MLKHLRDGPVRRITDPSEIKTDMYRERLLALKARLNLVLDSQEVLTYQVPENPPRFAEKYKDIYFSVECAKYLVEALSEEGFFARNNKNNLFICWNPDLYEELQIQSPYGPVPRLTDALADGDDEEDEEEKAVEQKPAFEAPLPPPPSPLFPKKASPKKEPKFVELYGSDFADRARLSEYLTRHSH